MTEQQATALQSLCERYGVPFEPANFHQRFDLPSDYVAGWVGPIYVGVSADGDVSS
jgi:hypothetical protein